VAPQWTRTKFEAHNRIVKWMTDRKIRQGGALATSWNCKGEKDGMLVYGGV